MAYIRYIAVFLLAAVCLPLAAAEEEFNEFHERYSKAMRLGEYRQALDYARKFCDDAGNAEYRLLALGYAGQSALAADEYDTAAVYLRSGVEVWSGIDSLDRTANDYAGIVTVYNALGISAMNLDMDYRSAVGYFLTGLRYARICSNHYIYAVTGLNLVVTYDLRDDPAGLGYAKEIYSYGQQSGDRYILSSGAYACALMYFLCGDPDLASVYVDEAMEYSDGTLVISGAYCLKARIAEARGEGDGKVLEYYHKAMENASTVADRLSAHLNYGKYLASAGKYESAVNMLKCGLELAEANRMRIYRYRFFLALSEAYEGKHDLVNALSFYKKYEKEYNSIYSIEKERAISELSRKYENEQHELALMKKSRELRTVLLFSLVVVIILVAVYILYSHKNRMYISIVRQHRDALKKESKLESYILELEERLAGRTSENEKYSRSSLEERRKNELFDCLEKTMREKKVYRESGLTGDRLAKMTGTNRTYLSQVVNEKTGMTLISYINSYRIDEALAALSDTGNDIPLKALSADLGFRSLTTFYKLFSDRVGMTPAKYREKVLYLSRKDI